MGFSSQQGVFAFKTQTALGTPATAIGTTGLAVFRTGGSMSPNVELMIPDAEIGGHRDVPDALLGPISNSGDIEFYTRFESIGFFLKAALGPPTSAPGTATGTTVHNFLPTDAGQLPVFTVYERIGSGLQRVQYTDCVVNTLHLEADANGYLTGTVGIIGCRALYDVTDIDVSNVLDESTLTVGSNIRVLHNGADLNASTFSIDINNNFEDDYFKLGSRYLADLTPKRREINGGVTFRPNDAAVMKTAVLGSATATTAGGLTTKAPITIEIDTYGEIPTSAPPTTYALELEFPNTVFEPHGFDPSGDDVIETDVTWQALRPSISEEVMSAKLTNGLAAIP